MASSPLAYAAKRRQTLICKYLLAQEVEIPNLTMRSIIKQSDATMMSVFSSYFAKIKGNGQKKIREYVAMCIQECKGLSLDTIMPYMSSTNLPSSANFGVFSSIVEVDWRGRGYKPLDFMATQAKLCHDLANKLCPQAYASEGKEMKLRGLNHEDSLSFLPISRDQKEVPLVFKAIRTYNYGVADFLVDWLRPIDCSKCSGNGDTFLHGIAKCAGVIWRDRNSNQWDSSESITQLLRKIVSLLDDPAILDIRNRDQKSFWHLVLFDSYGDKGLDGVGKILMRSFMQHVSLDLSQFRDSCTPKSQDDKFFAMLRQSRSLDTDLLLTRLREEASLLEPADQQDTDNTSHSHKFLPDHILDKMLKDFDFISKLTYRITKKTG